MIVAQRCANRQVPSLNCSVRMCVRSLLKALVAEAVAKQFCHGRVAYFARTRAALARVVRSISTVTGVDRCLWACGPSDL